MTDTIAGLHHVTAIAVDPQANLDFYISVLGLRLVKQTVNFDSPDVYHFYFADRAGTPGSVLTFFPFTNAAQGKAGPGTTRTVTWLVSSGALESWMVRLTEHGIDFEGPYTRFGRTRIAFKDPEGLQLEIAEAADGSSQPAAMLGLFEGVTLALADPGPTAGLFTDVFGYRKTGDESGHVRFEAQGGGAASAIELQAATGERVQAGGSVHHVAFRVSDQDALTRWRARIAALGYNVTPVKDRLYFRSIYFREPGGVLFELATEGPGFAVDEPEASLGQSLRLPPWLEKDRADIECRLPPIRVPARGSATS